MEDRIRTITREVLRELGLGTEGAPSAAPTPAERPWATAPGTAPAAPAPSPWETAPGTPSSAIRLVVFDLAGTTIRDDGQVLRCMLDAAAAHRLEVTAEEANAFMGAAKRRVFEHFVTRQLGHAEPSRVEAVYADFRRRLEEAYERGSVEPIAGTLETFRWLRARKIRIATTTGFYRRANDLLLARLGWNRDTLDASLCVDDVAQGRPAPFMLFRAMELVGVSRVQDVIKVGDTPFDLMEGYHAGVRGVVGVLSGAHGAETLGRARHTHLLPSVAELPELIESEFR